MRSLRSLSNGCCEGINGIRFAHVVNLVAIHTAEAGLRLRQSITNLTDKILRGDFPDYAAYLTTFRTRNGGILPVAVGNVFRRLSAKVGCHAVSHAVSCYSHDHIVIVKLDMTNAFNSARRIHVLQSFLDRTPDIDKLAFLAYCEYSSVIASDKSITSSSGVHKGDSIGSFLFSLIVDQIASGVQSEQHVWHLDDATIGSSTITLSLSASFSA